MENLITDVPGIRVGNAQDEKARTGVTVVLPDRAACGAADIRGGAPGTRETDVLAPENLVDEIHGIVLSGGSAMGLEAADGVMRWALDHGYGFDTGDNVRVPIIPAAILFDLKNGGDKSALNSNDGKGGYYRKLGMMAAERAGKSFQLGNIGAGCGAQAGDLKGGLGSASSCCDNGATVGAMVAVNSAGQTTIADSGIFWAWPFERDKEFGGKGPYRGPLPVKAQLRSFSRPGQNTSLAVIATDMVLTKAEARRVAIMAQDGLSRAIYPVHTPYDGDVVFAISTMRRDVRQGARDIAEIGMNAADCLARAVARAIFHAKNQGDIISYQKRYLAAE